MRPRLGSILYLASLGMFALAAWLFAEATMAPDPAAGEAPSRVGFETAERAVRDGKGPDRSATPINPGWWEQFKEVNITGVRPPEPVTGGTAKKETLPPTEKPLHEIFLMISLVYHDATQNAQTQVVLRYRPDAGVEIPPHLARRLDAAPLGASPLASAVPLQGRGRGAPPTGSRVQEVVHQVSLGESLWAPYDHIVLVQVAEDARSAFFLRTGAAQGAERQPEQVFKNEMDLDPEVARQLIESLRDPDGQDREAPRPRSGSAWVPVEVTTRVGDRQYRIGRLDHDMFRLDPQKLFDQLTFRSRSSTTGAARSGIELLRVDRELGRRFGLRDRDVILEINDNPVRTRSQIIERVRRSYREGVRVFRVRMLTMGRIEERTYLVPES